jgi:lipoate-protein ligase A
VDHALAACSSPGEGVLRIYQWSRPTVSFGRNEPSRSCYDRATAASAGIEFVRRPTGGRSVLHDRELTYAVVLPLQKGGGLRTGDGPGTGGGHRANGGLKATYRLINQGLVEALRSLGVPASLAEHPDPVAGLDSGPCFNQPASGEVTTSGRKLVGSAQARLEGAILQHGSLLIGPGQERLRQMESASGGLPVSPQTAPISLEEVLGRAPPWSHLVEAVISGLKHVTGGDWHRGELTDPERVKSTALAERYASDQWTWRR